MNVENLAAIDLGTNSCRLFITDKQGNVLYRDSYATKLGEGLHDNMCLTSEAINRGLAAFTEYANIIKKGDVKCYRAIATAACRMASNGDDFVRQIYEKTGIKLEVVDAYEEARLNLKGASTNANPNAEYVVIFDIGGGSTEITLAKCRPQLEIIHTVSIPWGGRNASDAFGLVEFDEQNRQKLEAEISKWVQDFVEVSNLEKYRQKTCLIATSSTPLRLVSMAKKYGTYQREKSDGVTVKVESVNQIIDSICKMSLSERENSVYIGKNRAPIFIAACIIFKTIYDGLQFDEVTASLKGAQEGIIEELMNNA